MSGDALWHPLDGFLADVPELAGLKLNPRAWRAMAGCVAHNNASARHSIAGSDNLM
jgi:hypothetical protein